MAFPIVMPSFGMYTAEGTLVSWLRPAGAKGRRGKMMRPRAFLIAGVLGVTPILSPQAVEAQFFSSVHSRSDAPAEARDASSKALAGLSRVLAALSNLETGNEAGAKENFDTATASLSASITSFS